MRHDTRKINEENPLVIRGLYGGGGGGGGGDSGDAIGNAVAGVSAGVDSSDPIGGIIAGINGGINGSAPTGQLGTMLGLTPSQTLGAFGMLGALTGASVPGMGAVAGLGNTINGMTGFGGGTPSTGTGDPGSPSSPGSGSPQGGYVMANTGIPFFDAQGNYQFNDGSGQSYTAAQIQASPQLRASYGQLSQQAQASGGLVGTPYRNASYGIDYNWAAPGGGAPGTPPAAPAAPAGAAPAPAGPDAIRQAQIDLVNQQRDIATQMYQRQQALQDQLMAQQGYEPNGQGGYRLNATAQAAADQNAQIASQLRQRTLDALAGNLPVDPALERGLTEQRQTLNDQLRSQLGSGYATSTPGIQALANFDQRAEELRSQQRHDQLTTAQGLQLAGQQTANQTNASTLQSILGLTNSGQVPAGILSSAGSGLNGSLQNLLGYSSLDNALNIARLTGQNSMNTLQAQLNAQDQAGYGQLLGQLGSAFIRSNTGQNFMSNVGSGIGNIWSSIFG